MEARREFLARHVPEGEIDLAAFPQSRLGPELVDPRNALPASHRYPHRALSALHRYATRCAPEPPALPSSLRKALRWHRYLCGDEPRLPAGFFEKPPYLHPSGASFVGLALASSRREFTPEWGEAHRGYRHLLEVEPLPPSRLRAMLEERPLIEETEKVFIRRDLRAPLEAGTKYVVYPRESWDRFLAGGHRYGRLSPWLLAASLALLSGTLAWVLFQWARARLREHQARTFALQTLTHEPRTPATTLSLCLESLRRNFDFLPERAQTDFLRMCDETQRLARLIQASTQYLGSGGSRFEYVVVPSVNEYFEHLLDPYGDRVAFAPLGGDGPYRLEPFWLGLCVKNLVENGLRHGKPPVRLALERHRGGLRVTVADGGSLAPYRLEDLMKGDTRLSPGAGLGLGLQLVDRIARRLKARLSFEPEPTTFSLWFRSPA